MRISDWSSDVCSSDLEVLAIIGKTGSGKSTLANLLMRMYDVEMGTIRVDGHNIRQLPLQAYRSQIGFVPQDVFLFSETIGNNLAFGLDAADSEAVENAARQAAVSHNIAAFYIGIATTTDERGIHLP